MKMSKKDSHKINRNWRGQRLLGASQFLRVPNTEMRPGPIVKPSQNRPDLSGWGEWGADVGVVDVVDVAWQLRPTMVGGKLCWLVVFICKVWLKPSGFGRICPAFAKDSARQAGLGVAPAFALPRRGRAEL